MIILFFLLWYHRHPKIYSSIDFSVFLYILAEREIIYIYEHTLSLSRFSTFCRYTSDSDTASWDGIRGSSGKSYILSGFLYSTSGPMIFPIGTPPYKIRFQALMECGSLWYSIGHSRHRLPLKNRRNSSHFYPRMHQKNVMILSSLWFATILRVEIGYLKLSILWISPIISIIMIAW